ncbi:MAG: DUF1513 domain-containing protein [Pseudomonadota bacterium]
MTTRRAFLGGLLAASAAPGLSWADAGSPAFLAAALGPDGGYRLYGIAAGGDLIFWQPLPGRGHAAAAHPDRPEAVAFARRPGTFALVIDCVSGETSATLESPAGRHFYGHGAFSLDGTRLYTSENNTETLEGVIGIWETRGYRRIGEFASGGIGPHEIKRRPGSDILVVANGGIATHPESGRSKLNLPTMRANLSHLSAEGAVLDRVELPEAMRLNSIRHIDVRADGLVAAAMQWQGDELAAPPLLALARAGEGLRLVHAPEPIHRRQRGYVGSTAFSGDGAQVGITSPRGDLMLVFDAETEAYESFSRLRDVSGIAPDARGLMVTTGTGQVGLAGVDGAMTHHMGLQFDNHLVPVHAPV